ncbi:hypothetical protein ASE63_03340 [Bosea sp. Root381]|nr:hypothetical protein ASE63_03340 [Bosea sp. Root381]
MLVLVEGEESLSRLGAMEVWLRQWEIPYRVVSVPRNDGAIRVCFSEDKYARAFQIKFGALRVPADACAAAQAAESSRIDVCQLVEGK